MTLVAESIKTRDSWTVALRVLGTVGALLAFAILAASISLRLTTVFAADGSASSTLPNDWELTTRLVHRISASSLGLLALVAAASVGFQRRLWARAAAPVAWMVATTLVLAAIGPLTPGYRYSVVTIVNVVAGTALLMACWWLHVALAKTACQKRTIQPTMRAALVLLMVHIALGAAASAWGARGVQWVAYLHSGTAMLFLVLASSILWELRSNVPLRGAVLFSALLLALQVVAGLLAFWLPVLPAGLGLAHGLMSVLLAGSLVGIAAHGVGQPG